MIKWATNEFLVGSFNLIVQKCSYRANNICTKNGFYPLKKTEQTIIIIHTMKNSIKSIVNQMTIDKGLKTFNLICYQNESIKKYL